jgi:gamma-glutamylputrescine oxidase
MFGLRFPRNTAEHTASWYAATGHHQQAYDRLEGEVEADVVVVGGGFSGVNTALELTERGYQVVLLEANRIGWGASGRNGGQIIGGLGHNPERFEKTIGEDGINQIYAMGDECVTIIRERVERYKIDCDIQWGYCDVAIKPRHMRWLEAEVKQRRERGYAHELTLLDASQIKQFVGSDSYIGGMYNPTGGGHLHPMNLCLGEARAASAQGAIICEQSRVTGLQHGASVKVSTEHGSVRAARVVLCGNAYMENLVPELSSRVLPASSCIIATQPLSEELARSVLPRNVAVCDPRTALDYFRLTRDRRLLFGGLSNYTGLVPDNYQAVMKRKMLGIFPQLQETDIEYAWDGQMGIGLNRMPQAGKLADNVWYVQAYSGHGVAPTHIMARAIAENINAESERLQLMASIKHWPFPGGRYLRRPGMALGMLWFKARDYL